jgi:hypothetical protein
MSASLLIKQSTGMIYEHLYQSNSTIKLATAKSDPAVLSYTVNHGNSGQVVPILATNFLSSSPDISLPVANRIRINKDGRYRFKASVNVGKVGLTTGAQNLPVTVVVPPPDVATVPASVVFYLNFCDPDTVAPPAIPALLGKRVVSYINGLNFLQQVDLDTVITAFAGDEISLLATCVATDVALYGIAVPLEVPYMTLEVSEL